VVFIGTQLSILSRGGRQKRSTRQGPHSTTHRCVFRYFIAREALESEFYGRVLHIQVPRLGHSRSSRVCSGHAPILLTTSCGLRATRSISFKSTRRVDAHVDPRLICGGFSPRAHPHAQHT
jgi:hypothetical protein